MNEQNLITFFYYNIPVALYHCFARGNIYATLNDPKGKYPELYHAGIR